MECVNAPYPRRRLNRLYGGITDNIFLSKAWACRFYAALDPVAQNGGFACDSFAK